MMISRPFYDLAENSLAPFSPSFGKRMLEGSQASSEGNWPDFVHAQMQEHFWQDAHVQYEVVVTRGFTSLRRAHLRRPLMSRAA